MEQIVSIDLRDRAERSESFPKEWSEEKLIRSIERYEMFLKLAAKNPLLSIAPTSDIDEIILVGGSTRIPENPYN